MLSSLPFRIFRLRDLLLCFTWSGIFTFNSSLFSIFLLFPLFLSFHFFFPPRPAFCAMPANLPIAALYSDNPIPIFQRSVQCIMRQITEIGFKNIHLNTAADMLCLITFSHHLMLMRRSQISTTKHISSRTRFLGNPTSGVQLTLSAVKVDKEPWLHTNEFTRTIYTTRRTRVKL